MGPTLPKNRNPLSDSMEGSARSADRSMPATTKQAIDSARVAEVHDRGGPMAEVGVALSGGGHRAALFGLGALLYLADAGKHRQVTSVASVSGGSMTNAYVGGLKVHYGSLSGPELENTVRPFARQIAQRGTVWAVWTTWAYVTLLGLWLVGTVAIWWLRLHGAVRLLLFVIALLLWEKFAEQCGRICGMAFAKTVYSPEGRPARLRDIHTEIDHVLCATDLHAGEHVYFSGSFVCSYHFGWGVPETFRYTQRSSAQPLCLVPSPVRWLDTQSHEFSRATEHASTMALVERRRVRQHGRSVGRRCKRPQGPVEGSGRRPSWSW
jgi:hypothetical protein